MKCNTDGSFINAGIPGTAGWAVRDERGTYKGAARSIGRRIQNSLESELHAILLAIQHCWILGYRKLHVEGDNKKAIDILNDRLLHFSGYNWVREIKWWCKKFQDVKFTWTRRDANKVADVLAKQHFMTNCTFQYHYFIFLHVSLIFSMKIMYTHINKIQFDE
ncbi:hypothetical protein Bca4012_043591 [Brassica carinata]